MSTAGRQNVAGQNSLVHTYSFFNDLFFTGTRCNGSKAIDNRRWSLPIGTCGYVQKGCSCRVSCKFFGCAVLSSSFYIYHFLEPVCCKKQQKKSSWPITGLRSRWPLKILNGEKLILDDQGNHLDSYTYNQFGIIQILQKSPIPQTSNWSGTFFLLFLTANRL